MNNEVSFFFDRQSDLIRHLLETKELSLSQDAEQMLQKNLPLAGASYCEQHVCEMLRAFVDSKSGNCIELRSLIESTAIKRQYHTMFDWEANNVNKFLSLFGQDFKKKIATELAASVELTKASKDFLELGNLRNCIVHQNYATYVMEKSAAEIFELFKNAVKFIDYLKQNLK